jgi:hypothetical protein
MSWELMVNSPIGFKEFLNRCLKTELENFVCITNAQTRCDPMTGSSVLFVEVCMNESYCGSDFTAFQMLELITKYSKLYSIYETPNVKVIKLV